MRGVSPEYLPVVPVAFLLVSVAFNTLQAVTDMAVEAGVRVSV